MNSSNRVHGTNASLLWASFGGGLTWSSLRFSNSRIINCRLNTLFTSYSYYTSPIHKILARSFSARRVNIQEEYIGKGSWCERGNLAEYLKQRTLSIENYLGSLELSSKEDVFLCKIKSDYHQTVGVIEEEAFPFTPRLEKTHKTGENSGLNFLTEREIEFYLENGLIGPTNIPISQNTLQAIFSRYTGIPKTLSPKDYREARVRQEWQNKDILNIACHEGIIARVSSLLGDNIKVRFTGIHEVPPGVGSFSSLTDGKIAALCAHSDTNLAARLSKRGMTGPLIDLDSLNVWISISGTHQQNGPLYVFPKTHKWSILTPRKYLEHAKRDKAALERTFKLLSISGFGNEMIANHALCYDYLQTSHYRRELSNIKKVEIYTKPGDCLIFSSHLLHGSDSNWTSESRLAISIRYSSAMNSENEDNLNALYSIYTENERAQLGITNDKAPIIQVLGTKHHEKSKPINLTELRKILTERS